MSMKLRETVQAFVLGTALLHQPGCATRPDMRGMHAKFDCIEENRRVQLLADLPGEFSVNSAEQERSRQQLIEALNMAAFMDLESLDLVESQYTIFGQKQACLNPLPTTRMSIHGKKIECGDGLLNDSDKNLSEMCLEYVFGLKSDLKKEKISFAVFQSEVLKLDLVLKATIETYHVKQAAPQTK